MRRCLAVLGFFAAALSAAVPAARAETVLAEEFWAELQPLVAKGENTVTPETAINRILEEARWVFSGIVYGFDFSYTPLDRSRNVEEVFTLKPYYEIPWGDPKLTVLGTRTEGSRLFARLRYELRDFQDDWYRGHDSNIFSSAAGRGEASFFGGHENKIGAVESAVKNAVREYARTRIDNKPKTIRGFVVLESAPRVVIDSGLYKADCVVRLRIDEKVPYTVF